MKKAAIMLAAILVPHVFAQGLNDYARVSVSNCAIEEVPAGSSKTVAIATLNNHSNHNVYVVEVNISDVSALITMHKTMMKDGKKMMEHMDALTLAPGINQFQSSASHIMMTHISADLRVGSYHQITFTLKSGNHFSCQALVRTKEEMKQYFNHSQ